MFCTILCIMLPCIDPGVAVNVSTGRAKQCCEPASCGRWPVKRRVSAPWFYTEVKSDGHCLYRAGEDQLALHPELPHHSYQELRNVAADYMRSHPNTYVPFIAGETAEKENPEETLESEIERYCWEVQSTAAWGGQLGLGALSHALEKHIVVYSANLLDVEMGSEYIGDIKEDGSLRTPSVRVSYHRHAFGRGEHYNSVVPAQPLLVQDTA